MDFELRGEQSGDAEFLFELFAQTHGAHMSGFPPLFVKAQAEAQRAHYRRVYPASNSLVIRAGGNRAGRLWIDRTPERIHLVDIAVLPVWQGKGLGTAVIRGLQAEGLPVTLNVQTASPARRLYERLGFEPAEESVPFLKMEWRPPQGTDATN